MTRTSTKALAVVLGASIAISGVCTAFPAMEMEVSALDTTTQVTYPFATGENAFQYAPTFTLAEKWTAGGDVYTFSRVFFDNATYDFTDVDYIAVQMRVDEGNFPWFTVGITDTVGKRFMSMASASTPRSPAPLRPTRTICSGRCSRRI